MDWEHPPSTMAELCLWRVFCATTEGDIWQIIRRWIKKYGNPFEPFITKDHEEFDMKDYEELEVHSLYVEALRSMYTKK